MVAEVDGAMRMGEEKKEKEGKKVLIASLVTCRFTSTSLGIIAYMTG